MDILGFGSHLIIDGFGAKRARLEDDAHVRAVLEDFGKRLEPERVDILKSRHDSGNSYLIVLGESHLALHTFLEARSLSFSVFSRRTLDLESFIGGLSEAFGLGRYESYLTSRSKTYPPALDLTAILRGERAYVSARLDENLRD